jgi:hypothetical protein
MNGRTTGIEPAHGGFTIHCLNPLGYIRPYTLTLPPKTLISIMNEYSIRFFFTCLS